MECCGTQITNQCEHFQISIKTVLTFNAYTWIPIRRTRLRNDIFKEKTAIQNFLTKLEENNYSGLAV